MMRHPIDLNKSLLFYIQHVHACQVYTAEYHPEENAAFEKLIQRLRLVQVKHLAEASLRQVLHVGSSSNYTRLCTLQRSSLSKGLD